ncbi:S-layer homology domain-containing protein [Cyanobacteria bacterium FACHB-DQ100]|uniref:S-layer homology domain-containing protein n=1 Tax=unclassified Leptolyngbya TaxID=2650499 RepID=UPI001680C506|nr:S-layer homology domain-containing protein [Leptolyngbya sp. FACHB-17]MBD1825382.1 S-layer homology domain-containing protein [Cyanobacteria bacterium FACHB-DQ100]MBD2081447.1 S-layer homology domain-containing protein [Leptolyngbya sp. FACHB-17]
MYSTVKSGLALTLALGTIAGAAAPMIMVAPASAQAAFSDVASDNWASPFIQELASRNIIAGFPDGTFRPNDPVTRAQFAAILLKAFPNAPRVNTPINFSDVPSNYWGLQAIRNAYATGFLAGFPGGTFRPNDNIPRAQALVSLSNGLRYASTQPADSVLQVYTDASNIPGYARNSIAAATERRIVVNYPDVRFLNPNQVATRADVAAFVYQALVSSGQVAAIQSPYIVGQAPTQPQAINIPAGTAIPVRYDRADKILLAKNEPQPTPVTLTVAQNIVTSDGTVLIPSGSQIAGQLTVSQGAAQFTASELILANGQRVAIAATSDPITTTETVRRGASTGTILKDAVLGSAAAAGISAVTGDRNIRAEEVLIGTGVGALAGLIFGGDRVDLISIRPNSDLNLRLTSALTLPRS